jgi:hypothetical protein
MAIALPAGGPYARRGSWQLAQASLPEAESEGSKNNIRPSVASRPPSSAGASGVDVDAAADADADADADAGVDADTDGDPAPDADAVAASAAATVVHGTRAATQRSKRRMRRIYCDYVKAM